MFLQHTLDFPSILKLDLDSLIMSGHSFGGATCHRAVVYDKRFKASVALDPWYRPCQHEMTRGDYKSECPTIILNSDGFLVGQAKEERFHQDTKATVRALKQATNAYFEVWTYKNTNHFTMCDGILMSPLLLSVFVGGLPSFSTINDNMLYHNHALSFLAA